MKEAMWGTLIVMLGLLGIVIIQVLQNVTVTNDQTYYLLKETTQAAMYDSIDLAYYRTKGEVRIVADKFAENLARRFAESATVNLNNEYTIKINDIIETPPKVSVSIGTYVLSLQGEKFNIGQSVSAIIEAKNPSESGDKIPPTCTGPSCTSCTGSNCNPSPYCDPSDPSCSDSVCPVCEAGDPNCGQVSECIEGDLRFKGWDDVTTPGSTCAGGTLGSLSRDANYDSCDCGKWVSHKESITSPVYDRGSYYEYLWHFTKSSSVRTIDETTSQKVDATSGTLCGGVDITCPQQIFVGQQYTMTPTYVPAKSVNRALNWSSCDKGTDCDTNFATIQYPNPGTVGSSGVSKAIVTGKAIGTTTVKAVVTADETQKDSCDIDIIDGWACPSPAMEMNTSSTATAYIKDNKVVPDMTWGLTGTSASTYATINKTTGVITTKTKATPATNNPLKYTVSVPGLPTLNCSLVIKKVTKMTCSDVSVCTNKTVNAKTTPAPSGRVFSISNTNLATIDASTGKITAKDTPANITYQVKKDGYTDCTGDITIKDCSAKTNYCTVGTMSASISKSLPTLYASDIDNKTCAYYAALSATANPSFCGKSGSFSSCSKGKWEGGDSVYFPATDRSSDPSENQPGRSVTVSKGSGTYSVTWSLIYKYDGWAEAAQSCPFINHSRNEYTITVTKKGTLKSGSSNSTSCSSNGSYDPVIANCPSSEMVAGSSSIKLIADYSKNDYNSPSWTVSHTAGGAGLATQIGSINSSGVYSPQSTVSGKTDVTVTLHLNDSTGADHATYCTFSVLPAASCTDYYIDGSTSTLCLGDTQTYHLAYQDIGEAFTSVSKWIVNGTSGIVSLNSTSPVSTIAVTGKKVGTVVLEAHRQIGNCQTGPKRAITVKPTSYYCPSGSPGTPYYYVDLYGKKCYNPSTGTAGTCKSGHTLVDGKCYKSYTPTTSYRCEPGYHKYKSYWIKNAFGNYACGTSESHQCPSGYTLSGTTCYSNTCPSGTYSYDTTRCINPSGGYLEGRDTTSSYCPHDHDVNTGSCYIYEEDPYPSSTSSCDKSGYSYNYGVNMCVYKSSDSSPTCPSGSILVGNYCYDAIDAYTTC